MKNLNTGIFIKYFIISIIIIYLSISFVKANLVFTEWTEQERSALLLLTIFLFGIIIWIHLLNKESKE